jgi:hypothetical protein
MLVERMLLEPSLEFFVTAEGVAQELLDDVVLAAAVEELAIGAQHLDDARVDASGEEHFLARLVFGFDHGHGLSSSMGCDDVGDSRVMRELLTGLKWSWSTRVSRSLMTPLSMSVSSAMSSTMSTGTFALAQGGRDRPEAEPRGFWADQRPKTGGRSRPSLGLRSAQGGPLSPQNPLNNSNFCWQRGEHLTDVEATILWIWVLRRNWR